ncbi:MAG: DNA repair protein RecO [Magnetococcus sp. YQC-3]
MRCSDDALVLRRTPFRETSLLLHLFTRQEGVLTAIARGVRATGRSAPGMERAALASFHTLFVTRHARSAQALSTLTGVEIRHPRHGLLHRAAALLAAQLMQEICYRFLPPQEASPDLFALLEWAWDRLDEEADPLSVLGIFLGRMLRGLGYGWRSDCCAGCGRREALRYFSVKQGQVVCAPCAAPYAGPGARALLPHPAQTLFFLGDSLYAVVQQLEWTTDFISLPPEEKAVLYRIGMASLLRLGKAALLADPPFRQMIGLDS